MATFTIRQELLPEVLVRGQRLGRHVWHDSRSRQYPVAELPQPALRSVAWARHIPILDQGDVGSCTGNAMCGALATDLVFGGLPASHPALDEHEALRIYSEAEVIDGNGPYPPNDDGSYGLSVARAARADGLIAGYQHAFSFAAFQTALQVGPVIVGAQWLTGMDNPDPDGLVKFSGSVRGGHEFECRELDMQAGLAWFDNSWGLGWGRAGRFGMAFAEAAKMLAADGDVTQPLPASGPPPQPQPWTHPDIQFGHDQRVIDWAAGPYSTPEDGYAASQYDAWRHARGYDR